MSEHWIWLDERGWTEENLCSIFSASLTCQWASRPRPPLALVPQQITSGRPLPKGPVIDNREGGQATKWVYFWSETFCAPPPPLQTGLTLFFLFLKGGYLLPPPIGMAKSSCFKTTSKLFLPPPRPFWRSKTSLPPPLPLCSPHPSSPPL